MEVNREDRTVCPETIVQARIAKAMSASQLANMLGVTRQAVSRLERGKSQPSPVMLQKMGDILDKPRQYFFTRRQASYSFDEVIHFRKRSAVAKKNGIAAKAKAEWALDIFTRFEEYIEFPSPNLPDFEITNFRSLSVSDISEYARQLRDYWKLKNGPITNLTLLLENNGIFCLNLGLAPQVDAFSTFIIEGSRPVIINKSNCFYARHRFNAAHELGHLILHQNVTEEDREDLHTFNLIESQANIFGGSFMLPEGGFPDYYSYFSFEYLEEMKKRWGMSFGAMLVRLKQLGIISDKDYTYRNIQLSKNGYRRVEPLDRGSKPESPILFQKAFRALINANIYQPYELLQEIALDIDTLVEILNIDKEEFFPKPKESNIISLRSQR